MIGFAAIRVKLATAVTFRVRRYIETTPSTQLALSKVEARREALVEEFLSAAAVYPSTADTRQSSSPASKAHVLVNAYASVQDLKWQA